MRTSLEIRPLARGDAARLAAAFRAIGWHKPESQYLAYLSEQAAGEREVFVAEISGEFAGYVTLLWRSAYPAFREGSIPELADLNVLPRFQRRGIATALVGAAEERAFSRSAVVGIGVGLHPGYNAAQRMYVLRGYVPDARGVTYANRYVAEGERIVFDDELVLHLTKARAAP